jgi:Protein of unknown function (DUF1501)
MYPAVAHDSPYCEILCCWAAVFSAVLAGGGVQGGQTIGRSDKIGAYPASGPYAPADLAATIYFYSARSIAVENASDAGNVACYKPEAQAKGIE